MVGHVKISIFLLVRPFFRWSNMSKFPFSFRFWPFFKWWDMSKFPFSCRFSQNFHFFVCFGHFLDGGTCQKFSFPADFCHFWNGGRCENVHFLVYFSHFRWWDMLKFPFSCRFCQNFHFLPISTVFQMEGCVKISIFQSFLSIFSMTEHVTTSLSQQILAIFRWWDMSKFPFSFSFGHYLDGGTCQNVHFPADFGYF